MTHRILKSFLQQDPHKHHLTAFDNLLLYHIPQIVDMYGKLNTLLDGVIYSIRISNIEAHPDEARVSECIEYGLNYCCSIVGDICLQRGDDVDGAVCVRTLICRLPMMVGPTVISCALDSINHTSTTHGSFVMRGKFRTIPPIKTLLFNVPVLTHRKSSTVLQVRSSHSDKIFRSSSTLDMSISKDIKRSIMRGIISVKLPFQAHGVHVSILARAFGVTPPEFILLVKSFAGQRYDSMVFNVYETSILHHRLHSASHDAESAQMLVSNLYGKNILSTGKNILQNETFPHLKHDDKEIERVRKASYLAYCVATIILFHHGRITDTGRDGCQHSCIISSSAHLGSLFRLLFIGHVRTSGKLLRRALMRRDNNATIMTGDDIIRIFGEVRLSARLVSAVASGIWSPMRNGVSIALNSNNDDAINVQLRRINSSLNTTDGSHTEPRSVHVDQYGFICPAFTPDGDSTGLVYEMSMMATLSPANIDPSLLHDVLQYATTDIFVDILVYVQQHRPLGPNERYYFDTSGTLTGVVLDIDQFVHRFRRLRRELCISRFASIADFRDRAQVRVFCEEGLLCRPLIIAASIHRLEPTMTFDDCIKEGIVEYISAQEYITLCHVASTIASISVHTTHIEITEASLFGFSAGGVPFATSEQGPRLSSFTTQNKQIITSMPKSIYGVPTSTQLWHSHRSLVRTLSESLRPEGAQLRSTPMVLAFMALPSNQEDALIVKKSSIERGAMTCSTTRYYNSETINRTNSCMDKFEKPDVVLSKKTNSYSLIQDNGFPIKGQLVAAGDIVIGKTRSVRKLGARHPDTSQIINTRDISTACKSNEPGIVDSVSIHKVPCGTRGSVGISTARPIGIGCKATTNAAQKGVVGAIWPDEDMPFSMMTGISPDIIASPLSLTSRKTMSSLLESITGKVVAVTGDLHHGIDPQTYSKGNESHIADMGRLLAANGFAADGTEMFIDGRTGRTIQARLFCGVVDYYRLVHIASMKLHARSTGPRDTLTRQPKDGRRFGGGLRIGEMEGAALAAHGAAHIHQTRFRELSDSFEVFVCKKCCLMVDDVNLSMDYMFCIRCDMDTEVRSVLMPFTFMVLTLELLSTGVIMKFIIDDEQNLITSVSAEPEDE